MILRTSSSVGASSEASSENADRVAQQVPAGLDDRDDDEDRRDAVDRELHPLRGERRERESRGERVDAVFPGVGDQRRRVGGDARAELVVAERERERSADDERGEHPGVDVHRGGRGAQRLARDLERADEDQRGEPDRDQVLHLVEAVREPAGRARREPEPDQHGDRGEQVDEVVHQLRGHGQAARGARDRAVQRGERDVHRDRGPAPALEFHGANPPTRPTLSNASRT